MRVSALYSSEKLCLTFLEVFSEKTDFFEFFFFIFQEKIAKNQQKSQLFYQKRRKNLQKVNFRFSNVEKQILR